MYSPSVIFQKNKYWIFLTGLALVLVALGAVAISRYGAGVSSDSVKYMAVAQNLIDGKGLFDHRGLPLLSWPPLYPMILAGLGVLTRLDVFVAGSYLNVALLGVNLFLSGVIFRRVFVEKPVYAWLASLFVFLSISSLRIHATIDSDAPYLTMTLLFLIVIDGYVRERSYRAYFWTAILCLFAPLLRYVGPALGVTAGFIILIENRKSLRVILRDGFVLGIVSILPIFWWLVVHNVMTYGSLWGTESGQIVDVLQNTDLALTKMLHWFVPFLTFLMPLLTRPLIILGALALLLLLVNIRSLKNWNLWFRDFSDQSAYPAMIHAVVYFTAVALTAVTRDHRSLFSDRYYVILLVPTMIFIFCTYDRLILPHLKFSTRQASRVLVVVFLMWTIYPLYGIREYLANALERGEPSEYNIFNTRAYHEMAVVAQMQEIREIEPDAFFYSNYVDAVWFYTRKPALVLPTRQVPDIQAAYAGWPNDKPGYLVWFKPNEYHHYLSPEELSAFASLKLVFGDPDGDIYYVQPR